MEETLTLDGALSGESKPTIVGIIGGVTLGTLSEENKLITQNVLIETLNTSVTGNAIPFGVDKFFRFTAVADVVTASSIPTYIQEGSLYIDDADVLTGWSTDFVSEQIPTDLESGELIKYEIVGGKIYLGRVGSGFPSGLPTIV